MVGKVSLLFLGLFFYGLVIAETSFINFIEVEGNHKTEASVILTELRFSIGDKVSLTQLKEGIDNVHNTGLFESVDYKLEGEKLKVIVKERWTTIPVVKASTGGGVEQITVGVYDPNLFGKYVEAGAQYEYLSGASSGVLWFKNPRLGSTYNGLTLQLWKTNRLRTKYREEFDEPVIKTGFLHQREKIYLALDRDFTNSLKGLLFYEYNKDSFSQDLLSDEVKAVVAGGAIFPIDTEFHFIGAGLSVGRVVNKNNLVDGFQFGGTYKYGLSKTDEVDNFWQADLTLHYYRTVFSKATFAQRVLAGFTSTDAIQYWNYLGGLDRIRGFSDNRLAGRYFWLSNTELRVPVWRHPWVIFQVVGFLDIASATERFKDLDGVEGGSVGGGVRFILPKLYRSTFRFDYGKPIKKNDDMNFSFGVQQFF